MLTLLRPEGPEDFKQLHPSNDFNILGVFWPLRGVKMFHQTAPGEVKITSWRVPGSSWRPLVALEGSLALLLGFREGPRRDPEPAWRRLGPKWLPFWGRFGVIFWDTF